jgi:hypothetical protein
MLSEGQLVAMKNMVYRNGGQSLERATGRQVFGVVSAATAAAGLRDMHFDNGDHYLIGMAGTKYRIAPMGDTGTFADLATIASGTSLEVVQYRNRFFLMNGAVAQTSSIGTNVVSYLSATSAGTPPTTRSHGLLPVVAAPNVTTATGAFSQSVTGYYEYWTTEVVRFTQDGVTQKLESAFSSDNGVSTVFVSTTGVRPTIQQPTIQNSSTTHWRIYRSPKKDLYSDKEFPTGFMIAELGTGVSAHADTSVVSSASSLPGSVNTSGGFFGFASASSMLTDNGVYASGTPVSGVMGGSFPVTQGLYGFSLSSVAGSIKGIAVEIQGYVSAGSGPIPITAYIGVRLSDGMFDNGIIAYLGAGKSGTISSTNSASPDTITLGGSTDRWNNTAGSLFVDTDFSGSNFMVVLETSKPSTSVGIDYIKLYVYYAASVDTTVVYPTVVYTFGDITSQVSKNGPPPSSSTGDLFQDSMVVNDVSNPSLLRYSFPGEVESFPSTYYLEFETRENDQIRHIRVVNNRLIVGLDTSLWRVNYLPSERDSSFDRGKATEMISRSVGIVNPMCACTFTIDGETEQLAFVSYKGIHTTDGYNFITRSKNQTWRNYIPLTSTAYPIALLNDPENRSLRMFYRNDANGNETYLCLHMSYDPKNIDSEGNFKVSGPVHMRNFDSGSGTYASLESAWAVPRSNGNTGIYVGYGGTASAAGAGSVYFETGTAMPANDTTFGYTGRRIYRSGMSGEWMLDDLYGYVGSYSGSPLLTYTFSGVKTNDSGATVRGSKSITLKGQNLHKVTPKVQCEGLQISMVASGSGTFATELLILGSTDYGLEDAGT